LLSASREKGELRLPHSRRVYEKIIKEGINKEAENLIDDQNRKIFQSNSFFKFKN